MYLCSPVLVHQTGEPTSGPLEESARVRKATWADRCPRSNPFPLARPLPTRPDFLGRHLVSHRLPNPATTRQHVPWRDYLSSPVYTLILQMRNHRLTGRGVLAVVARPPLSRAGARIQDREFISVSIFLLHKTEAEVNLGALAVDLANILHVV